MTADRPASPVLAELAAILAKGYRRWALRQIRLAESGEDKPPCGSVVDAPRAARAGHRGEQL